MKKFNFKFQSVLHVRKIREQEFLKQLSRTQRAHQIEIEKKAQLGLQLEETLVRRENFGKKNEDIVSFYLEDNFIIGTKQKIIQAEKNIIRASKAVDRALQVYLLAKRESKVMETLLEKAKAEYRKELRKKEEKDLDEMVMMRNNISKEGEENEAHE